ncbi:MULTISPECIES: hypothetical protein [unclassified Paenibacillus]|uniref:hypothetical protein n=1 Tax=unclassified Paenibacillus TaxID=185978 RepID=UPI0038382F85
MTKEDYDSYVAASNNKNTTVRLEVAGSVIKPSNTTYWEYATYNHYEGAPVEQLSFRYSLLVKSKQVIQYQHKFQQMRIDLVD